MGNFFFSRTTLVLFFASATVATLGSSVAPSIAQATSASCESIFNPVFTSVDPVTSAKDQRRAALKAVPRFDAYFKAIGDRVLEREGLIELAEVALLAEEHLLLMGPPGNAKSQLSDFVLGNVKEASGEKSYFRIQMTPETTMSETHGPMDYKKLSDTGEYDRLHMQGMGAKRNVFIDEIFDARANAQRNILGLLAERSHAQGSHVIKAEIETVIGATNKYLSEVYERAGDDGPKAVLDRFALVAFVPATFENADSYVRIIQRSKRPLAEIPALTFNDLEALRGIVPQVEISDAVAKALSLLSTRMKAETEALEAASLKAYSEKIKNGEEPSVPYRATKYHSPRTIGKASAILRAFVVRSWIEKKGKRKLEATIEDLQQLMKFFTLNGPGEDFVRTELARTSNKHERAQLMAILQEREVFERHYTSIVEEMDSATVSYALNDLVGRVSVARTAEEKQVAAQTVIEALAKVVSDKAPVGLQSELTGFEIGKDLVQDYLEGLLKGLVTPAEFATMKRTVLGEIERQKREVIERAEAARRQELERVQEIERAEQRKVAAEKAALEMAEKRSNELRDAFTNPERFKMASQKIDVDPRSGAVVVGYDSSSQTVAVYFREYDRLQLYDTNRMGEAAPLMAKVVEKLLGDEQVDGMEISQVHFADSKTLILLTNDGKAEMRVDLETRAVDVSSLSLRSVASAFDSARGRTITFDTATLKLKSFAKGEAGTSEQFRFVETANRQRNWDAEEFKEHINGNGLQLQLSENGKYGVLINSARDTVFKLDFERKEVLPLDYEVPGAINTSRDADPSFLNWYDSHVVVIDRSGPEPLIKKLLNESSVRNYLGNGASAIDGTNLLVAPKGTSKHGWELVNGTDGTVLSDVFVVPGHIAYGIRRFKDGHVLFSFANDLWYLTIVKQLKPVTP